VIKIFLFILFIFFIVGCSESVVPASPPTTIDELVSQLQAQPSRTKVKLLFVVSAKKGIVYRLNHSANTHLVTINKKDLTHVIAFTDRPARQAYDISLPMFSAIWAQGKNNFRVNPPNSVLTDDNGRVSITVLTSFLNDPKTITFQLNREAYKAIDLDSSLTATLINPVLVIDSSILTVAGLAGLLRAGAKACVEVECYWALAGA
jgi:hypothetical protein